MAKNVLFIVADQLRADCVFGDLAQHADLPNLRALMADAVTFTNHHSVTNPCGPARASLLTGQYAMNHRSVRNRAPLRHDTPTLPTEMR
ncbi:MAG: sulfatase-like hydrolase/transferase, partial [Pseudomonadota bacterium]